MNKMILLLLICSLFFGCGNKAPDSEMIAGAYSFMIPNEDLNMVATAAWKNRDPHLAEKVFRHYYFGFGDSVNGGVWLRASMAFGGTKLLSFYKEHTIGYSREEHAFFREIENGNIENPLDFIFEDDRLGALLEQAINGNVQAGLQSKNITEWLIFSAIVFTKSDDALVLLLKDSKSSNAFKEGMVELLSRIKFAND